MADNISTLAPIASLPDEREWKTIFQMAQQLVPTGFLPKAIDTPQKAAAILLKGRELGIPPMQALANIAIINGKPSVQAELMMAMVKRAYGRDVIWVEESTDKYAKVGYLVHGKPRFYSYTIEMAQQANLTKNPTWGAHPAAMLRARTVSAVCRMEFPEVIGGMYVAGELGEPVKVDEVTGEVTSYDYEIPETKSTIAYNEADYHNKAMRRLHAIADKNGLTHDDLTLYAKSKGASSIKDFEPATLDEIANGLEHRTEQAMAYFTKIRNDAELAEAGAVLNAQIDGETSVDSDGVIQGELVTAGEDHPGYGDA